MKKEDLLEMFNYNKFKVYYNLLKIYSSFYIKGTDTYKIFYLKFLNSFEISYNKNLFLLVLITLQKSIEKYTTKNLF